MKNKFHKMPQYFLSVYFFIVNYLTFKFIKLTSVVVQHLILVQKELPIKENKLSSSSFNGVFVEKDNNGRYCNEYIPLSYNSKEYPKRAKFTGVFSRVSSEAKINKSVETIKIEKTNKYDEDFIFSTLNEPEITKLVKDAILGSEKLDIAKNLEENEGV